MARRRSGVVEHDRTRPTAFLADADDHARATIHDALERAGWSVTGEAATAAAAVGMATAAPPDVLLLAVNAPADGIRAARNVGAALPGVAVVLMSNSTDEQDVISAFRAGVCGYLLSDMDPSSIPAALRAVLEGEIALPRSLVGIVIDELRVRDGPRFTLRGAPSVRLTYREWDVLELLAADCSTAEIARRLYVSRVTVRSHVANICKKLGVADRQAVVRIFHAA